MHEKRAKVLFVGDKPSKWNTDPSVAFVGTKSWVTLQKWLAELAPDSYAIINRTHPEFYNVVEYFSGAGKKIVALGNEASKALSKLGVEHEKLPHPSGRNRLLNDKAFLAKQLNRCKNYLHQKG